MNDERHISSDLDATQRRLSSRRGTGKVSASEPPPPPPTPLENRLREAFDVFDNKRTKEIDVRDLGILIRALGCVITGAELQEIQVEVEDVQNNCIPMQKFVEYMNKAITERRFKPAEPEDLLKSFKLLDSENCGFIMKDDLGKVLMEVGEPFTQDEVDDMMTVACDPETNRVYYEDYINLLIVKIAKHINVYDIVEKMEADLLASKPKKRRLESLLLEAEDRESKTKDVHV